MKLKDLEVGKRFRFVNGNLKTYQKKSNNGSIMEYNQCVCLDDLRPEEKSGLMLISPCNYKCMNKESEIILI